MKTMQTIVLIACVISLISGILDAVRPNRKFDRQMQLLGLILHYESLCRGAVDKAVAPSALYAIPAREKLGWAKYAAAEEYAANYAAVRADMEREIAELIRKAGEEE